MPFVVCFRAGTIEQGLFFVTPEPVGVGLMRGKGVCEVGRWGPGIGGKSSGDEIVSEVIRTSRCKE